MADSIETDLVVLGSGAAGLTAALTAALDGLRVLILERADRIGGTSARSSGTLWIPGNHYLPEADRAADREQAERYLEALMEDRGDPGMRRTFLDNGLRMLADLDDRAGIRYRPYWTAPDYRQDCPGAAAGGRPLEPLPFDGRALGPDFDRIAWPIPELTVFGGMMVTRGEAVDLLRIDRSPKALWLALRLVGRFALDRLRFQRGTRLVIGNALVARLFKAVLDRQVAVWTGVRTEALVKQDGRVGGVEIVKDGSPRTIRAHRGIVLAGGGFPAGAEWRKRYLPEPVAEYTPAAPGCDGTTLGLALNVGAALGPDGFDNALWFPSSIASRADGSTAVYPHIVLDRAKPGLIAVNQAGRRFVNEAVSYHEFVRGMYRAHTQSPSIPAWLVCDRAFIRKYGLGLIRPRTPSLRKYVDSGYLRQGATIADLAVQLGMEPAFLEATVARVNGFALTGIDEDFAKGDNIYDRSNGDPAVKPNPCLGPIASAPFYAVAVVPTPLGTSRGLAADTDARVLDEAGKPIPGLYVCGNDMQSPLGGEYPGPGAQLGPGMTFGWLAARHAAGRNRGQDDGRGETR